MRPSLARLRGEAFWERARADALELADTAARRWLPPGQARGRIDRALTRHARPARHRMTPLLEAFAELRPRAGFVQVGANQDPQRAPLREMILRRGWSGIIAEPNPIAFQELERSYGQLPQIELEPVAVGPEDGERPFYHLGVAADAAAPFRVPGSLLREPLLFRRGLAQGTETEIVEITVPCLTFDSLCRRHRLERFDVLLVDTEGYDLAILDQVDLDRFRPALIVYDHHHLVPEAKAACAERLRRRGCELLEHAGDTWCLRPGALADGEAERLMPIWRWTTRHDPQQPLRAIRVLRTSARRAFGDRGAPAEPFALTDREERYLATGYDDSAPLPNGAAAYLSPQNPRLLELRRAYEALEIPAVDHHMWRPVRVNEGVNLRYFRGDNLYLWHYPDHPRASALALFVYMRYLESRGAGEVLESVAEDGGFGCWTTEIPGYGRISRDLLDSVNEILFLDRQLAIRAGSGLRVLDIGAGYGRLAHRISAALPTLADYCCVDAVPESTFLSEYYLRLRGCSPPARVVPLTDVHAGLEPGTFDLAVNIHSFSECTLAAIEWWADELNRLRVPHLFVVPNEPDGLLSREPDGSIHDALPTLAAAGYRPTVTERVIADPAVRELVRLNDNFYLFTLDPDAKSS